MYTAVLMAALSTAPTTQAWHRHGCHGCNGCQGCYGTRGYVAANTSWYGHGSGCFGCYHGWNGGWNGWHGSNGWHGNGSGCFGCHNGWSGCYYGWGVGNPYALECNGCYGAYGGWSCYGMPQQPAPPFMPPEEGKAEKIEKKPGTPPEVTPPPREEKKKPKEQARARVLIEVPADAKLYIDDNLMPPGSTRRVFQTPELATGETYFYDVRAEVTRDGRVIRSSQRLLLRPGEQARASFADLGTPSDATAQGRGR